MRKRTIGCWTVAVIFFCALFAAAWLYYVINEQLRGEYETIRVVQMIDDYVKTHDGNWPSSWEDLDATETASRLTSDSSYFRRYTRVNFALTSEQIFENPALIYDAVKPMTGRYTLYPHARKDLDVLMQTIRDSIEHREK